ncbi:hypothetical protein ACJX0J_034412 [Zea mays]
MNALNFQGMGTAFRSHPSLLEKKTISKCGDALENIVFPLEISINGTHQFNTAWHGDLQEGTKYGSFGHFSVKLGPFTSRTWDYQWLAGSGTMECHIYARMFYNVAALELHAKEMRDKNEYKTDLAKERDIWDLMK